MANFYGKYNGLFGSGGGGGGGGGVGNRVALAAGATNGTVTFASAFQATPAVLGWLTSSAVSPDQIFVIGTAVTTAGFTFTLSTQTPDNTYTFNWMATEANG